MADRVLLGRQQLRRRHVEVERHKDRVVAKTARPPWLPQQRPRELCDLDVAPPIRQRPRRRADERRPAALVRYVGELPQHELQVREVVAMPPSPARREDPRHPVQRLDGESAVVRHRRQTGLAHPLERLRERVLGEGRTGLRTRLVRRPDQRQPERLQDPGQLGNLALVAGGQQDGPHSDWASTAVWSALSCRIPPSARSSSASSSARENGAPSAVPCTSMMSPSPVATTFMSVSARTSSV